MSISASLDIKLFGKNINPVDIFKHLINYGWKIEDNGKKVFLPVHDNSMFNWQSESEIEDFEIINILNKKNSIGEILGISLSWLNTNIGGEFLINQDLHIIVSLSNNRQINNYEMTDFDWYLSKIIPILRTEKIYIESVIFSQYN